MTGVSHSLPCLKHCKSACACLTAPPCQVPFCIVFTKCDARKKGGPTPAANIKAWKQEWLAQYEEVRAVVLGRAGVWRHQLLWGGRKGGEGLRLGLTAKP